MIFTFRPLSNSRKKRLPGVVGRQRLRPHSLKQPLDRIPAARNQDYLAEHSRITQHERTPVEKTNLQMSVPVGRMLPHALEAGDRLAQESRGIRLIRVPERQLPRHPEVNNQNVPIEMKEKELAPAGQEVHRLSRQPRR